MLTWLDHPIAKPNLIMEQLAKNRQANLTKPPNALGRLEEIPIKFAAWQGKENPTLDHIYISIFAADHGIANSPINKISAFPQAVTAQMVHNFIQGGAAISVLAKNLGVYLEIIDTGVKDFPNNLAGVISNRISNGTLNFSKTQAMNSVQLAQALEVGYQAAKRAKTSNCQLFVGGEMGIGNTSSATALSCLLLNQDATTLTGAGTGLNTIEIKNKAKTIQTALQLHKGKQLPLEILQSVGGFEIAALVGAYVHCAQLAIPILIDGFITTVAALIAIKLQPDTQKWMLFSHTSAETGHKILLDSLQTNGLLNLNMRLGEASGAAIAISLIQQALLLHNNMATFAEAGVSRKINA